MMAPIIAEIIGVTEPINLALQRPQRLSPAVKCVRLALEIRRSKKETGYLKPVHMGIRPPKNSLKNAVQTIQRQVGGHLQTAPYGRLDAVEHYLDA
jgi:hypothetical protein